MDSTWYHGVVVGVDGSPESLAALSWAARAADLHGARLTVVAAHAVPADPGPGAGTLRQDAREQAHRAAGAAREQLAGRRPGGRHVQTMVAVGTAAHVLAGQSRTHDLAVVGRRRLHTPDGTLLGSTSSALTATAGGAIAVVPAGAGTDGALRVRVGVGRDDEPAVLETAFAEAGVRGCPLEVVHVATSWHEAAAGDLTDRLDRWSDKHPEVAHTVTIRHGDLVAALLRGLSRNDVLVVGGRGRTAAARPPRSMPDAVLRDAPCPVVVVHTPRDECLGR